MEMSITGKYTGRFVSEERGLIVSRDRNDDYMMGHNLSKQNLE